MRQIAFDVVASVALTGSFWAIVFVTAVAIATVCLVDPLP